jgi:hypothetical protein
MNKYKHTKTGNVYVLLCQAKLEADETLMAVYRREAAPLVDLGKIAIWVRPWSEFEAKFERI